MERPIILVSPLYDQSKHQLSMQDTYTSSLQKAGAIPLVVPFGTAGEEIAELAKIADGYFFTGGQDIHPNLYGESVSDKCGDIIPCRDALDLALFQQAYSDCKPIFGICRGFQLINACLGGTLYQDLKTAGFCSVSHTDGPYPQFEAKHTVTFPEGSLFQQKLGRGQALVNSYHHQGIKTLAPSLTPLAYAEGGLVEAYTDESRRFLLAVQWHPERMDDDFSRLLWNSFAEAASAGK